MSPEELQAEFQRVQEQLRSLQEDYRVLQEFHRSMKAEEQLYQELLTARDATIAEQQSLIDQLKRMLFGPKSEKMTPEQAAELAAVVADLNEQEKRPETDARRF